MPRAVGLRIGYAQVPEQVRSWVQEQVGPATVIAEHRGGMSPGCATSLESADGQRYFVKAVGEELNARTVEIFRGEVDLLRALPPAPYRPPLLAAYDHDGWVALLLEQVDGRYPDFDDDADFAGAMKAVTAQVEELTPPPFPANPLEASTARWLQRWGFVREDPHAYLPTWAAERADELYARAEAMRHQLPPTTLCHTDVRDDNFLIRPDGSAVVLDWGMASLAPAWLDPVLLATQRSTDKGAAWLKGHVAPEDDEAVTNLLVAFGGAQAWRGTQPNHAALPAMADYCREDATRLLALAEHRLRSDRR